MAEVLSVQQLGQPVLRQIAQPIHNIHDEWVQTLIDDLLVTLHHSNGVGIAAPQIGQSHRLLIVASHPNPRYPAAPEMAPLPMLNPHLVSHSETQVKGWEGCLSVPGIRGLVPRYDEVEVEYVSRDGRVQRCVLTGFVARIFQHEFDHLNGLVFLDRVEGTEDLMSEQEYFKQIVHA